MATDDPRVHERGGFGSSSSAPTGGRPLEFGLLRELSAQGVKRPGHRFFAQSRVLGNYGVSESTTLQAATLGIQAMYAAANHAGSQAWLLTSQAIALAVVNYLETYFLL